ncbi:MAG: RHS repeat-associated core domain-containing protein, partial [Nanoarchaeota archaeon]|nr:RHS repeat-associated core domain-containing protein [Nanoarchaeota archaeon]
MVMTDKEYTKHYFIEGERVCTKVGGGFRYANTDPDAVQLPFINGTAASLSDELWTMTIRGIDCSGYPSAQVSVKPRLRPARNDASRAESQQYFYHPDHLGSSSFITNAIGYAEQHLQYLPHGELFVNQQNSMYDTRYKFSAKELDDATNYSYFGARYYDSDLSSWLSVDPLSDKYPSLSPYMYVAGNPVIMIDPNGEDIVVSLVWPQEADESGHMALYVNTYKAVTATVTENGKSVTKKMYVKTGTAKVQNYPHRDRSATTVSNVSGSYLDNNVVNINVNTVEGVVADGNTYYSPEEVQGEIDLYNDALGRQSSTDKNAEYHHGESYKNQNDCSSIII